jgi:hypothetical protein
VAKLEAVSALARQELKERGQPPLVGFEMRRQLKENGACFLVQK